MDDVRYAIVKHRPTDRSKILPATVPMQDSPNGVGKGITLPVTPSMWRWIAASNSEPGYRYARSVGMMWINGEYRENSSTDLAKAESITCEGNIVSFTELVNNHIHLRAFPWDEDIFATLSPLAVNWRTRPDLFIKATATNYTARLWNVAENKDVYLPLMKRAPQGVWLPATGVEIFPGLPFVASIRLTTGALRIRQWCDVASPLIDGDYIYQRYFPLQPFILVEYRPRGASIWGRTERGWVCLLLAETPGQHSFLTTWGLATPGVIPAATWPPE